MIEILSSILASDLLSVGAEVQRMLDRGARAVTLGPRIFRTETAGLAAIIAAMALSGNLE